MESHPSRKTAHKSVPVGKHLMGVHTSRQNSSEDSAHGGLSLLVVLVVELLH